MTQYQTEADLQDSVIELAMWTGWMVYHTRRSDNSEPGFTDLVMVRPPIVIFAEVKTQSGRLTKGRMNKAGKRLLPGQADWRRALMACPGVIYRLWRPSDWDDIEQLLTQGKLVWSGSEPCIAVDRWGPVKT